MVYDAVLEYILNLGLYWKPPEIKVKILINHSRGNLANYTGRTNSWEECIQIIIHVWLICKSNFFYN